MSNLHRLNTEAIGLPWLGATTASFALNAAGTWDALGFIPPEALTVSELRFYIADVVGAPVAADISVELQADSATTPGQPSGTALATIALAAAPTVGWRSVPGFATALTAGQQYWFVIKNLNAAPATNYISVGSFSIPSGPVWSAAEYGWSQRGTTNSGASWPSNYRTNDGGAIRVRFTSGLIMGVPIHSHTGYAWGLAEIYAQQMVGSEFIVPPNASRRVIGLEFYGRRFGTVTWNIEGRLYKNGVLAATTHAVPYGNVGTGGQVLAAFFPAASVVSVVPGDVLYAVSRAVGDLGDASNGYRIGEFQRDTDADSVLAGEGLWQQRGIYRLTDAGAWTASESSLGFARLILAGETSYSPAGGGFRNFYPGQR